MTLPSPVQDWIDRAEELLKELTESGGWCGNPGYGYFYQDVMEYQKQRAAGRNMPKVRQADPALLTELKAALEDFQAARLLLDEQTKRLEELAAKLLGA